jgi:hypothetical protein
MTIGWQEQLRPGVALRKIVRQATEALIAMDASRLEELARCCADLNRELWSGGIPEDVADFEEAADDLKLLDRVLFETRANLTVFTRLHLLRGGEASDQYNKDWKSPERNVAYGDN